MEDMIWVILRAQVIGLLWVTASGDHALLLRHDLLAQSRPQVAFMKTFDTGQGLPYNRVGLIPISLRFT